MANRFLSAGGNGAAGGGGAGDQGSAGRGTGGNSAVGGGAPGDPGKLPWTLSYQTVLPEDYRTNDSFSRTLSAFRRAGLWGLELNMRDPADISYDDVVSFLSEYDLNLSMFATGLSAKTGNFSLSALDESARKAAVEECAKYLRWVRSEGVGAIIGFMKGMDKSNPQAARLAFQASVQELAAVAEEARTPLIIEATNRYETPIANTVEDALALVEGTPAQWVKVLPDTFHMNIEEADMRAALEKALPRIMHVHLSENNRTLPGRGGFDFSGFLKMLSELGFTGRLAMEGNIVGSEADDVGRAAGWVASAWAGVSAG
ncbi:MAG: TIM barrel protein [bacterium]